MPPNGILAKYTIKERAADIDLSTVKEFSNPVHYDNSITVYTVEDTEAGQEAVRRIIDANWGKDANPWCLAARHNSSLDEAWGYWNDYNSIPKRIAFKDGKLLAFCASDKGYTEWWDREDTASTGIPYTVKTQGGSVTYEYHEEQGKERKVSENLPDGTVRTWYENGRLQSEELPNGTVHRWYEDGSLKYERLSDGTIHSWYSNGNLESESLPDGTERGWHKNGNMSYETLQDRIARSWYANGNMENQALIDGTISYWHENGKLSSVYLPDSTKYTWDEDGRLIAVLLSDGTEYILNHAMQQVYQRLPSGIIIPSGMGLSDLNKLEEQASVVKAKFDSSPGNEVYSQSIGERGVRRLDELEGTTSRMDALSTAKMTLRVSNSRQDGNLGQTETGNMKSTMDNSSLMGSSALVLIAYL